MLLLLVVLNLANKLVLKFIKESNKFEGIERIVLFFAFIKTKKRRENKRSFWDSLWNL